LLRRAENVDLSHTAGIFTGKGWLVLTIGRRTYRLARVHRDDVAASETQQQKYPCRIARIGERTYWKFQNRFYWENDDLTPEQVHALLVTRQQREAQRIDRAQQTVAMGMAPRPPKQRGAIPDDVKHLVWTRDRGRCRACGSTVELQFDHIIPVAMGGSSSPENLQILCGPCNRRKGASITVR
jgi:5-methylcytosine-specific restriction endonuclease McrA